MDLSSAVSVGYKLCLQAWILIQAQQLESTCAEFEQQPKQAAAAVPQHVPGSLDHQVPAVPRMHVSLCLHAFPALSAQRWLSGVHMNDVPGLLDRTLPW
jgi:hypothetical protein